MGKISPKEPKADVVASVFEDLIQRLKADKSIDQAAVERLRAALLENREYSVEKLRQVLFPEDPIS